MSYLFAAPAVVDPKQRQQAALAAYLGDTCTIMPNGARVCTSDVAPTPVPVTPAACPPCPPQMACPDPVCPPAPTCPPQRVCPPCTPIDSWPRPTPMPLPPILPPRPITPSSADQGDAGASTADGDIRSTGKITTSAPAAGFARYAQLAAAARARMLQGLGDECQVYANGARVCNAPGPGVPGATVPAKMVTVCTNEPMPINWQTGVMTNVMRPVSGVAVRQPPIRTRRVCRQVPAPVAQPATPVYTTSTVAPVDNTTLPPAPVPAGADDSGGVSMFDYSSIPTWVWYGVGALGVYWLFFKRG